MGHRAEVDFGYLNSLLIKAAKHTAEVTAVHCEMVLAKQGSLQETGYAEEMSYVVGAVLDDLRDLIPDEAAFLPMEWALNETITWFALRVQKSMLKRAEPLYRRGMWRPGRNPHTRTLESIVTERAVLLWHELHELGLIVDDTLDYAA